MRDGSQVSIHSHLFLQESLQEWIGLGLCSFSKYRSWPFPLLVLGLHSLNFQQNMGMREAGDRLAVLFAGGGGRTHGTLLPVLKAICWAEPGLFPICRLMCIWEGSRQLPHRVCPICRCPQGSFWSHDFTDFNNLFKLPLFGQQTPIHWMC